MCVCVYVCLYGSWNVVVVVVTALMAACCPLQPIVLLVAFAVRIFQMVSSMPYLHDSQHWCLQTDLTLITALILCVMSRPRHRVADALAPNEAARITSSAGATIRVQLFFVYTAAALFKVNQGFMSPRTSCASVYFVQLAEAFLPASMLSADLVNIVTKTAPIVVLLVEILVPVLLVLAPKLGVPFVGLFHTLIAITPPPNDIGSFGAQLMPRMLFYVPDEDAAVSAVDAALTPSWQGALVMLAAAVVTALQPKTWTGKLDYAVPICGAFAAICTDAALRARSSMVRVHRLPRRIASALCSISFIYSFLMLPLGLSDVGNPSPFASLRKHAGSNHYFLPTGLLQRAFIDAPPSTILGDSFGGGVIRVEMTNSSHLTGPRDILAVRSPTTQALLREAGHAGTQYSPNIFAGGAQHIGMQSAPQAIAYTLPAAGLRRLIHEARVRYPSEDFFIVGSVLPGAEGDEAWRATASQYKFSIARRGSVPRADDFIECIDPETNVPCESHVHNLILSPPSTHWIARLLQKLILQKQLPVLILPEEEERASSRILYCP